MRILHLAKYDLKGGAAIAAYNSMCAQRELGIDARMAVARKLGDDPFVMGPSYLGDKVALARFAAEQLPGRIIGAERHDSRSIGQFGRSWAALSRKFYPDVAVLHNIDGLISLREIRRINIPIIWRMHDMWPISGHRHYGGEYYQSPTRFGFVATRIDHALRRAKLEDPARPSIVYCAPSMWLADRASAALPPGAEVKVVPNGVDADVFRPHDRSSLRHSLGIDHDGPLVLFGASTGASDPRKGADLLAKALHNQSADLAARNVKLAVFGGDWPGELERLFPAIALGKTSDRARLAQIYSAADLTVVPSREENLSLTVLESLACGTPVAAFDIGGMPDMIEDGVNGWLIPPFDLAVLGKRITQVEQCKSMRRKARESILGRFDRLTEARGMLAVYRNLVPSLS